MMVITFQGMHIMRLHGQYYDGLVTLICSFLDESSNNTHEMGHAFNLPHTFDGDDQFVGACGDDNIFDTPMHDRNFYYFDCDNNDSNDCDPNFNVQMSPTKVGAGTHQDHIHNYMNYSACRSEFTFGQRDVSKYALITQRVSYLLKMEIQH